MAKVIIVKKGERILALSRNEALEVICLLTAALADESLVGVTFQGISCNALARVNVTDRGHTLYRLTIGLEDSILEEED